MDNLQPKLRFREFKGDWEKKKLLEICDKIKDGTHFSPKTSDSGDYQYLTSKNVKDGYIDFTNLQYISKEEHNKIYKSCDVKYGDVLLTKDGTIGQCCVNNLNYEFSLLSSVAYLRLNTKHHNYFLYQLLVSDIGQSEINKAIAGQALKRITLTKINDFCFSFPSLEEQTKIANFLSAVDEKINLLKEKKSLLEDYKKGIMQKIFKQEIRFKDDNGNDFEEWEKSTINDVCICLDNLRKPLNGQTRQNIQGKYPYWGANNIMDYIDDYIFDETIVLLAEDGGNFNEYKTRPIANLSKGKCWVNNHTHVLKGIENILSNEFLYYSLVHKDITGYVSGGTRSKLIKSEMLKIPIIVPCIEEQTKIANFLSVIDEKIDLVSTQIEDTQVYKKGLLQQMFI